MAKATEDWTESLDFTPLMTSIDTLLKALAPLTDNIGAGLSWLYREVLLPLAGWAIEDALPAFLDALSGALKFLNEITEALQPTFQWLWDDFLAPIAAWTGGVIVSILEGLASSLSGIGDFVSEHQVGFSNFVVAFASFAGALKVISGLKTLTGILSGVVWLVIFHRWSERGSGWHWNSSRRRRYFPRRTMGHSNRSCHRCRCIALEKLGYDQGEG